MRSDAASSLRLLDKLVIRRDVLIAAVADYLIGKSHEEIHQKYQIAHNTIIKAIRRAGLKTRRAGKKLRGKANPLIIYRKDGTMKLHPVQSSNIDAVGYDPETKELQVRFKGGALYSYAGVPKAKYDSMLSAQSLGGVFHTSIRNEYKYTKLE